MYQTRTSRDRRSLFVAVLFAVTIVGYLAITRAPAEIARSNCITLNVAASQEKSALLTDLAKTYSRSGATAAGHCVDVKVAQKASGAAEEALARGWDDKADGARPDVWSPASTSWLVLLRQHRSSRDIGGGPLPPPPPSHLPCPPLLSRPPPGAPGPRWPPPRDRG